MKVEEFKRGIQRGEALFNDDSKIHEAIEHFDFMITTNPDNLFLKNRLIKLQMKNGNWTLAEQSCEALLDSKKGDFLTQFFYAQCLIRNNKTSLAHTLLNEMKNNFPAKSASLDPLIILSGNIESIATLRTIRR